MVTGPVQRRYQQGRLHSSKDGMTEGRLMPLFCLSSAHTSAYLPLTSRRIRTKKMDQSLWLCNIWPFHTWESYLSTDIVAGSATYKTNLTQFFHQRMTMSKSFFISNWLYNIMQLITQSCNLKLSISMNKDDKSFF